MASDPDKLNYIEEKVDFTPKDWEKIRQLRTRINYEICGERGLVPDATGEKFEAICLQTKNHVGLHFQNNPAEEEIKRRQNANR